METNEAETTTAPAQADSLEQRVAALENELAALAQFLRLLAIGMENMHDPTGDPDERFHFAVLRGCADVCKIDGPDSLLLKYLAMPTKRVPPADSTDGVQNGDAIEGPV